MKSVHWIRGSVALMTAGIFLSWTAVSLHAAQVSTPLAAGPVLLAKSWLVGYALVFLAILLGMLAVLIPSMRKALRKKES